MHKLPMSIMLRVTTFLTLEKGGAAQIRVGTGKAGGITYTALREGGSSVWQHEWTMKDFPGSFSTYKELRRAYNAREPEPTGNKS